VLRGVSELQVSGRKTTGTLLKESLARRLEPGRGRATRLADIGDLGLILNSTITGHPHGLATDEADQAGCPIDQATRPGAGASSTAAVPRPADTDLGAPWQRGAAGGILAYTNLRHLAAFPRPSDAPPCAPQERLTYVLVGGVHTELTAAAALSANFPPVFPNAAVDLAVPRAGVPQAVTHRYWVTDGGAAENRGAVSLLYALQGLVQDCAGAVQCARPWPDLHLVVADASASDFDYRADRGLGALNAAAQRFSGQLMAERLKQLRTAYEAPESGKLLVSYLSMPAPLRSRGGLGTHWKMPSRVVLKDDTAPDPHAAPVLAQLDEWQTLALITCLHDTSLATGTDGKTCSEIQGKTRNALRQHLATGPHALAWQALLQHWNNRP
jgi:hypothetical protein